MFLKPSVPLDMHGRTLAWLVLSFVALVALAYALEHTPVRHHLTWHNALEATAIVVSGLVFAVGWTAHRMRPHRHFVVLSCGFLGVALLDLGHVLSYPGMPAYFTDNSLEKAINFWLVARYLGALATLLAIILAFRARPDKPPHGSSSRYRYGMLAGVLLFVLAIHVWFLVFPQFVPRSFRSDTGLTPFKKWAEFGVIVLLLCALVLLVLHGVRHVTSFHRSFFMTALVASVLSEVFFILYASADDFYNLVGHAYKVVAWLFLYRAIVEHTVVQPYAELRASESRLQAAMDESRRSADTLRKLKLAVEQSPNTIMITDLQSRLEYANAAFALSTGYTVDEALGKTPALLHSGKNDKRVYDEMWRALGSGKPWRGELVNRCKDGVQYLESVLISPVKDEAGKVTSYLAIKDDITQQRLDQERIAQLSNFDALTGLPNRALFSSRFQAALASSRRGSRQLAVLCISMDNFKNVNDSLGHDVGDDVLVEVAGRLRAAADESSLVARYGGDEFIVVLPNADVKAAAQAAEAIQADVRQPCRVGAHELVVTASIGIALSPEDGSSLDTLLQCANAAAFQAKADGRDSFRFFSIDMQRHSTRMLQLENALRWAIPHNELRLVYQPQVHIATGRVVGVEALVRWDHPELGAISPAEFIPVAENSGQMVEIGDWILRTALHQARRWQNEGLPELILAVNLSLQQFRHEGLLPNLDAALLESGFPAGRLELELTESIAMDDPEQAVRIVQALRERGVLLSIDDFGTGYSSLSYLKRLRLNKLKIDKSFVDDIAQDGTDAAIVTAIVGMARSMDMITIAEGVETPEQLEVLGRIGCDEVQGYLFSKPLSVQEMEAYLRRTG